MDMQHTMIARISSEFSMFDDKAVGRRCRCRHAYRDIGGDSDLHIPMLPCFFARQLCIQFAMNALRTIEIALNDT